MKEITESTQNKKINDKKISKYSVEINNKKLKNNQKARKGFGCVGGGSPNSW